MALVEKLLEWVEKPIVLLLWVGLLAAFAMMVHVGVDVFWRTALNSPFAGTTEIVAGWYMVAIAFLPWTWIARNDNHIVAGMFQRLGGPRFEFWLEVAVKIWTILFLYFFVWQTWIQAERQTRINEVWQAAGGFIPIWPARWLLPISGALMLVYLVLRVIRDVMRDFKR
jgi:TRAP-type C4-dicarboxylate transport system permease small subunit